MYDEILAKNLKQARINNNMSEYYVASKLHLDTKLITQFENGSRKPFPDVVKKLASLYNCSINYLFGF